VACLPGASSISSTVTRAPAAARKKPAAAPAMPAPTTSTSLSIAAPDVMIRARTLLSGSYPTLAVCCQATVPRVVRLGS
jgi:hypothetical protein